MKDEISRITALVESVIAAQNQSSPSPATPSPQRTVIYEIISSTVLVATASQTIPAMPAGFLWGMPPIFVPEGYAPIFVSLSASSPIMSVPPPIVRTLPCVEETIYHSESSEGPYIYEKMDEMKDQFLEMRKELKTLRGKDLFGKSVAELCLVPNVKIFVKFKVPDFEKYKGNTCSLSHLVIGAPGHDIENCYPLKYKVQKLVKSGMVSFKDRAPNVKANSLSAHGNTSVNMVDDCLGNFRVLT
ncbi:hypothetical protein KIW84_057646 [Lathyrus oleraceus]|uniref:Uncharacterized protein n=1 Tax=Pisum sativum TaxID=3888 RepID=A0A9D4X1N9_PEA|nr:hypothetical protein KIW84_057646 [Pisum sativum]